MTSSILTFSGKLFDVLNPDPNLIDLVDIAAALSKLCRFGGHCRHFYSVAEHSVLTADLIQQSYPGDSSLTKWALLHDASEAYMVDIPRPVKRQLQDYVRLEDAIQETIAKRFGLPWPMPHSVHHADEVLLATEARDLMAPFADDWHLKASPLAETVIPISPMDAEALFLARAKELGIRNPR